MMHATELCQRHDLNVGGSGLWGFSMRFSIKRLPR